MQAIDELAVNCCPQSPRLQVDSALGLHLCWPLVLLPQYEPIEARTQAVMVLASHLGHAVHSFRGRILEIDVSTTVGEHSQQRCCFGYESRI